MNTMLPHSNTSGGQSASYDKLSQLNGISAKLFQIYIISTQGYGFAAFCYFVSFTLCLSAAIIVSPLLQGYVYLCFIIRLFHSILCISTDI